jgi:hypothetical protein
MKWTPGSREHIEDRQQADSSAGVRRHAAAHRGRGLENGSPTCDTVSR